MGDAEAGDGPLQVLHVDPDQDLLERVAGRLRSDQERVRVTSVGRPDEALDALDGTVDCVVSAHELSDMDGLEFLRAVRERRPVVPFVLFTDQGSEALAGEAISAGVDAYVPNDGERAPVDLLLHRIETLVSGSSPANSYREVFEQAGVAMSIRDPETGEFVDVNRAYCELMGYSREEVRGMSSREVGIDEGEYTTERAHDLLRETVESGERTVEWINERRDGTRLHVGATLKPAEIDGRTLVLVSVNDITEQRRHEQRIRRLQHRTEALMRAHDAVEVADIAVETAKDTLGLTISGIHLDDGDGVLRGIAATEEVKSELGGIPDYHVDAEPRAVSDVVREVYESGETLVIGDSAAEESLRDSPMESGIIHPLGDHGVFITSSPEFDAFDETDEALAEVLATTTTAALDGAERQRRYEAIFNRTFQFTSLMDPDGTLVEVNRAALEFAGADRDPVVGTPLWESPWFRSSEEARRVARESVEQARDGEFYRDEVEISSGEESIIIDYSVRPITDQRNNVVLLVQEGRDISELKRREAELERKNEQLEEFASVVSHDLRNPLSVATGRLELARDTVEGAEEDLEAVAAAHDRMRVLIDDLLELARQGRSVDVLETVELESLARDAWQHVDTQDARIRVDSSFQFEADGDRAVQLFENVFRNAIEHGGPTVTVTVGVTDDAGFYVEDDGPGLPDEELGDIFQAGTTTAESGTGFGLSIVNRIAEAHGWSVTATEGRGGGARFEITGVVADD